MTAVSALADALHTELATKLVLSTHNLSIQSCTWRTRWLRPSHRYGRGWMHCREFHAANVIQGHAVEALTDLHTLHTVLPRQLVLGGAVWNFYFYSPSTRFVVRL